MNGSPAAAASSFNRAAVSKAKASLSMTHGPAMRNRGSRLPTSKPQSFTAPPPPRWLPALPPAAPRRGAPSVPRTGSPPARSP